MHLQLKANIIKRFCQKILNKIHTNNFSLQPISLISIINNIYFKKNGKIFIHHLKIKNNSKELYNKLLKLIYFKIISNISFNLNVIYNEIKNSEKKHKLFEQSFHIQNSHYLKKKMIITSTQQIEEKNAEFEYRKNKFYQNLAKKSYNKEEMKQSKRKFYWRPFQCQESKNKEISTEQILENKNLKNIESNYMYNQEMKEEIYIQKETLSYKKNEELEYFEKGKKFYWLPYHSIESSKEINKLKNTKHTKLELNDL